MEAISQEPMDGSHSYMRAARGPLLWLVDKPPTAYGH